MVLKKPPHLQAGASAESRAESFLRDQGLQLIERNFRCRSGEIDLVMLDRDCLVFVEVRYRKNANYGGALESITAAKQDKIRRTAEWFLQTNVNLPYQGCRFDVIAASGTGEGYEMQWIVDAFQ